MTLSSTTTPASTVATTPTPGEHNAEAGAWPTGSMEAVVIVAPGELALQDVDVPGPAANHVLVRPAYVGLCGTDAQLYKGTSIYLTSGMKKYPFVFGHEWSGTVVAVPQDDNSGYRPGDHVVGHPFITCDVCPACRRGRRNLCTRRSEMGVHGAYPGAASQFASVPAKVLTRLPDSLPFADAAMIEPSVTAVQALERTRCGYSDRVAVIGTGTLGLVAVQVAAGMGAQVDAIGVEEAGLQLAAQLGAARALRPEEVLADHYTVVVEASGAPTATGMALEITEPGGRIALVGVAHRPVDSLPIALAVLKDLEVHGVLHGIDRYDQTVRLVEQGTITPSALVDEIFPYTAAEEAFQRLLSPGRAKPKVLLRFNDSDR